VVVECQRRLSWAHSRERSWQRLGGDRWRLLQVGSGLLGVDGRLAGHDAAGSSLREVLSVWVVWCWCRLRVLLWVSGCETGEGDGDEGLDGDHFDSFWKRRTEVQLAVLKKY